MANRAKRFRWIESHDNKYIYNFNFYQYTPSISIILLINENQILQKEKIIGSYTEKQLTVELKIPFSGRVTKIFQIPQKQSSKVELFSFQKCDHKPKQNTNNSIDNCIYCDQELWAYEQQKQISYCRKDFKQIKQTNGQIQWKGKLNQRFSKSQVLGTIGQCQIILGIRGRISYLSTTKNRDSPIIKIRHTICKHQKIVEKICCFCHQYINTISKVPMIAQKDGIETGGRALLQIQNQMIQKLMKQKRLILILDLDNTILHCQQIPHQNPDQLLQLLSDYFIMPNTQYVIKMRPYLKEFLKDMTPLFNIFIYTKATRDYAQHVCSYIKYTYKQLFVQKQYQDYFTPSRILSRNQDTSFDKKSLKNVITQEDYVLILDDRKDVWDFSPYVVQTKEYKHFFRNEDNKIVYSKIKDPFLLYTKEYLKEFHKKYFECKQKNKQVTTKKLNKYLKHQRLKNYKIMFPPDTPKQNKNFRHALQMGATQFKEAANVDDNSNHLPNIVIFSVTVVSNSNTTTAKTKDSKYYTHVLKIPLVHQYWIDYCYQYNYKFPYDMFLIENQDKLTSKLNQLTERQEFEERLFSSNQIS